MAYKIPHGLHPSGEEFLLFLAGRVPSRSQARARAFLVEMFGHERPLHIAEKAGGKVVFQLFDDAGYVGRAELYGKPTAFWKGPRSPELLSHALALLGDASYARLAESYTEARQYPRGKPVRPPRNDAERELRALRKIRDQSSPERVHGRKVFFVQVENRDEPEDSADRRFMMALDWKTLRRLGVGDHKEAVKRDVFRNVHKRSMYHEYETNPGDVRYSPLTKAQKKCANRFVGEEIRSGKFSSRQQAIAVGLSRARKEC